MILQTVLLIDSNYCKTYSTISSNIEEKFIVPCIVTAQVQDLQSLIGTSLASALAEKVDDGSIDDTENAMYKELLDDYVKPFLLAATQSELLISNAVKMRNSGNMQYIDTAQTNVNMRDVEYLVQHYRDQVSFLGKMLTDYLKCHRSEFPEYSKWCNCCGGMEPDEQSAIHIPLYL